MLGAGYACGDWRPQAASCEEGPALIRYLFTARLRNQQFPRAGAGRRGAGRRAEIIPRQARKTDVPVDECIVFFLHREFNRNWAVEVLNEIFFWRPRRRY
jgi:hypothetical protein